MSNSGLVREEILERGEHNAYIYQWLRDYARCVPESRYEKTFEYGGVVGLRAFSNRKQEIADLIRVFENGTC